MDGYLQLIGIPLLIGIAQDLLQGSPDKAGLEMILKMAHIQALCAPQWR
jgi:hypothetical protein